MARFAELLDESKHQVFLMKCPATLPFSFAAHTWLIANRKGVVEWYSVSWRKAREGEETFTGHTCRGCIGYLHKGDRGFGEGIDIFPFIRGPLWGGRVISFLEGDEESGAARIARLIESSFSSYPYGDRYRLTGPNSNTYPAWILARFPEAGMRLPWNAVGKGFNT